ncbi:MAG: UDP-N-acetylglucosamine 2-epimerase [Brumimicrobium sp.]
MKRKIAIFTGARSEFGIMKNLIKRIDADLDLDYSLYVSGMHLLKGFGDTFKEIEAEGIAIHFKIPIYTENKAPDSKEFSNAITAFSEVLSKDQPDGVFIIGDRPEAYAMALAAHFNKVKVYHSGGGTITKGAVDNIYRYNITNLSTHHLTTSIMNYERLLSLPTVNKEDVYFTGSVAIDAIFDFLKHPVHISDHINGLEKNFCLMTFHAVTQNKENIAEIMNVAIETILKNNFKILITYPNNDPGYQEILEIINKWESNPDICVVENLGSKRYYAAMYSCDFVIGNSSSGIIEAPYFNKPVINIGTRQEGREADDNIISINANTINVKNVLNKKFNEGWKPINNNNIYGKGEAMEQILKILKK